MLWLWISLAFVIMMTIVLWSDVEVVGIHTYRATHRDVRYEVKALFGMIKWKIAIPVFKFEGIEKGFELDAEVNASKVKEQVTWTKLKRWYSLSKLLTSHVDDFYAWFKACLARVRCTEFRWQTELGTGDAASGAFLSGMAWSMKSTAAGVICNALSLQTEPQMNVVVRFNDTTFSTQLDVKVKVRHVELVRASWTLFIRICKIKGGLKVWWKNLLTLFRSRAVE